MVSEAPRHSNGGSDSSAGTAARKTRGYQLRTRSLLSAQHVVCFASTHDAQEPIIVCVQGVSLDPLTERRQSRRLLTCVPEAARGRTPHDERPPHPPKRKRPDPCKLDVGRAYFDVAEEAGAQERDVHTDFNSCREARGLREGMSYCGSMPARSSQAPSRWRDS